MPGECTFQNRWLQIKSPYYSWIAKSKILKEAVCKLCHKTIDLSNMGEGALKSHAKSIKHIKLLAVRMKSSSITDFNLSTRPNTNNTEGNVDGAHSSTSGVATSKNSMSPPAFVTKTDHLKAEILWTLKTITDHQSYKSCEGTSELFKRMFPDSDIAKSFSCGERKASYLSTFGLAPHFSQLLRQSVKKSNHGYVLLFDESLNHKTKSKQMDIHIRLWNSNNQVSTRYYNSVFMGHGTSEGMIEHFKTGTEDLNLNHLVQLSMDGPNVNWKFFNLFESEREINTNCKLINIGSCGLHIVHGAFKKGAEESSWNINKFLTSLDTLFKDTPARREDYTTITSSTVFPLKFCPHRWIENLKVAQRAVDILPNIKTFVEAVTTKKVRNPGTVSYDIVKHGSADPLILCKLSFFISVCQQIQTFLTVYQTDKPMVPFLAGDLFRMIKRLLERFVKESILERNSTICKIVKIDLNDKDNILSFSKINLGMVCEKELKGLTDSKKLSERQVMEFRIQCKDFLLHVCSKLFEKCPLKYSIVRCLRCIDPVLVKNDKQSAMTAMKNLLKCLSDANRLELKDCDGILSEFKDFIDVEVNLNAALKDFDKNSDRLDELYYNMLHDKSQYSNLWNKVISVILLLSHGQASVERGFSVNKEIEVENLHEKSLIAQRVICDHTAAVGGILNVDISNSLLVSASSARHRYGNYLDEQKESRSKEEGCRKRKLIMEELDDMKKKKKRLESDIVNLIDTADHLADKAEACGKLTFITQSNSLRNTSKIKKEELKKINMNIDEILLKLKE